MAEIIDFQEYKNAREEEETEWIIDELMCAKCYHRYFSTYPENLMLKDIECPKCKTVGTTFCTGQVIPDNDELMAALDYLETEFNKEEDT